MLEVGKTYKAIQDKEKLIEFEVLKVNKKSYTIMLKDKKETLWIRSDGKLYLNNPNYSSGWSMTYRPSRFCIEVVDGEQAKIFTMSKRLETWKMRIGNYKAEISDLETEENKIKNRKNDLKIKLDILINEVNKLEKELEGIENDKKERE